MDWKELNVVVNMQEAPTNEVGCHTNPKNLSPAPELGLGVHKLCRGLVVLSAFDRWRS